MGQKSNHSPSFLKIISPFVIGGLSGVVATSIIQPIDTFKVQIQIISEKMGKKNKSHSKIKFLNILKEVKKSSGLTSLYRGLVSAIIRQLVYTSVRIGSYNAILDWNKRKNRHINKLQKILFSMLAGMFGALVGTPFDVILIRRQASISTGLLYYSGTIHAFGKIIKQENIQGLWTGLNITILRVILINVGQLVFPEVISDELKKYIVNPTIQANLTAILAAFLTSFISSPADNIKVKLQKQIKSQIQYKGIIDCFSKSIQRQGIPRLWVGFPIYLLRGAPHSFILIRTQQYLTSFTNNLY